MTMVVLFVISLLLATSAVAFQSSTSTYLCRLSSITSEQSVWTQPQQLNSGMAEDWRFSEQLSLEEQRAAALSDYLAKAHEAKLRAVDEVNKLRQEEVYALKLEIDELRRLLSENRRQPNSQLPTTAFSTVDAGAHFASMSKEQLVEVAENFVAFVSKYVVDSSIAKYLSVKAAEESLNQKWEERLRAMTAEPPPPPPLDLSVNGIIAEGSKTSNKSGKESPSYLARNSAVVSAANAGRSRWGDREVQRICSLDSIGTMSSSIVASKSENDSLFVSRNLAVSAAGAAGKSRWGDREVDKAISGGSTSGTYTAHLRKPIEATTMSLFEKRNAAVSAAAVAGKSRWGNLEIQKASAGKVLSVETNNYQSGSTFVPPEVVAADHGLRADGGVGGLTLAERVLSGANASSSSGVGKISSVTPTKEMTAVVPPEVVAADHGLRADGGVGGLTLAERVLSGSNAPIQGSTLQSTTEVDDRRSTIVSALTPTENVASHPDRIIDTSLYGRRNAAVIAAADKSRWGSMEIGRIKGLGSSVAGQGAAVATGVGASHSLYEQRNARVLLASKAGKSRWGEQESGRVARLLGDKNGAVVSNNSGHSLSAGKLNGASAPTRTGSLYDKRNAAIAAAGAAGQSRWGAKELEKARGSTIGIHAATYEVQHTTSPSLVSIQIGDVPVPPEVAAADHGLRADGGVGGLTLAERVAFGSNAASIGTIEVNKNGVNGFVSSPSLNGRINLGALIA